MLSGLFVLIIRIFYMAELSFIIHSCDDSQPYSFRDGLQPVIQIMKKGREREGEDCPQLM